MATAKKVAKKPAAKPAAKRVAAKKPAVRKPAAKKTTAASSKSKASLQALQGNLASAANTFIANGRKDLDALLKVNKHSYSELQSLVKRRTALLKDAIKEWQAAAKDINVAKPLDSVAKLDELSKNAFKLALDNIRELADLAAKSQADAFKVVKQSIEDNVSEVSKLLKGD